MMIEYTPDEICAKLTTGACPRDMFPQLKYNLVLKERVIERLYHAGYEFVDDPISNCYDARLKQQIRSLQELVEGELGKGLTVQAKAMIAILWCYLILPRIDSTMSKDLQEESFVTEEQLYENFKKNIGSRQNLRRTLTLLRQYNFIQTMWGKKNAIKAGPRLSTAINPVTMYDLVKDKVIDFLILENEDKKVDVEETYSGLEEIVSREVGGDDYASAN
ncbi:hypothetical protein [Lysinibacillus fusiformis]|uniref:hypothetical protein n=1 Tax=Lysinibacillus fusiformis TaxID=28031 RepID=UPI001244FD04|nr:hypothetical protein [Lysinibacillus fusiformis]